MKPQCVGDPARSRVAPTPDRGIEVHVLRRRENAGLEVAQPLADIDAGLAALKLRNVDAGILERLPRGLEHQSLLRVELLRFSGRDTEEGSIEPGQVAQEPTASRRHAAPGLRVLIKMERQVETIRWDLSDPVPTFADEAPEAVGIHNSARKAAADSDDRDSVVEIGSVAPGHAA